MSSKIRIKTAQTTAAPSGILDRGELAFTYANNKLWVGNINGTSNAEIQIGGEVTASQADITTSSVKIPTGKAVFDYVASKSPVITLGGDLTGSVTLTGLASGTLNATIAANSVALGTDTTGNYVATIAGTTNQVSVSGSGSETAAVTLSLPQDIHSGASPTFAGATLDAVTVGVATASTITTTAGNLVLDSFTGTTNVNDNLIVSGNLTVQGTTTTVDSTVVTIVDPIFTLGSDTVVDTYDRGIAFKYKDGVTNREGFFGWDRSDGAFVFKVPNAENDESDGTIAGTSYGSAIFSNITGAIIYADQIIGNTGYVRIDEISIQTGGNETTINSEQLNYSEMGFAITGLSGNLFLGSVDLNTYFDNGGNLSVGNSTNTAGISVYGNITSTNTGVSSIDGFVIDGGTF